MNVGTAGMLLASLTDAAVAGNDLWSKVKKILAPGRDTAGGLALNTLLL